MIRHATANDLPAIVAIYNASIPGRMATADLEPVTVAQRQTWFNEHTPERWPIWVDERDGEVAGWLSLSRFVAREAWDPTAEVGVYVAPEHRRQGVARELVRHAMAQTQHLGITSLLCLIFRHNEPSIGLFGQLGFQRWGSLPGVTNVDGARRDVVILGIALR